MLLFQHNNLKSGEWVGIRRELTKALRKADEVSLAAGSASEPLASGIKIQIIQTGIFAAALRVVEFYRPGTESLTPRPDPRKPSALSAAAVPVHSLEAGELTHTLSAAAHAAVADTKTAHALAPLLSGPLMLVTFPSVSSLHMKAALSILAPSAPDFPAPTRRANPGYHDLAVQSGLQKLLLLGARVDGTVFDVDRTKWVGKIEGGLDGLRAQLVSILQGAGAGITNSLEGAGRSLYLTIEGRRIMLEDEEKGPPSESA